ncbi:probable salivary secreted peptide [Battus philenor]|uniref:probable salivary secreted peptide n=1 Tax=Battus philenor TaxID=42288 RepID=UPI0035CEA150
MASKVILLGTIFLFYLATSVLGNGDLTAGYTYGKQLIHHEIYTKKALPLQKRVEEVEIKAPENRTIQGIIVKDMKGNGESYIKRGGIGMNSVTLKLKSEKGHGFKFSVDVYA